MARKVYKVESIWIAKHVLDGIGVHISSLHSHLISLSEHVIHISEPEQSSIFQLTGALASLLYKSRCPFVCVSVCMVLPLAGGNKLPITQFMTAEVLHV